MQIEPSLLKLSHSQAHHVPAPQGEEVVDKRAGLLDRLSAATSTVAVGEVLREAEAELTAQNCMTEEWARLWRKDWREEVMTCGHLQDTLLYTVALQVSHKLYAIGKALCWAAEQYARSKLKIFAHT